MNGTIDFYYAIPSLAEEYLLSDNIVFSHRISIWLFCFVLSIVGWDLLLYYVKSSRDFRVAVS